VQNESIQKHPVKSLITKLEIGDISAWKVVRAVTRTKTITPPPHLPATPNEYVSDPQKKCELLAYILCPSFQSNPVSAENRSHATDVDKFANSLQQHNRCRIHKYKWPQIQIIINSLSSSTNPAKNKITLWSKNAVGEKSARGTNISHQNIQHSTSTTYTSTKQTYFNLPGNVRVFHPKGFSLRNTNTD
jgi:hypothetical protein